jgi:ribonuclease HI
MPWVEATLRGQKVLARASAEGKLVAEGGRVEIRYKPSDGRSYRASVANLNLDGGAPLFPDDHCVEVSAPAPRGTAAEEKRAKKAASAARVQPAKAGEWVVFTDGACSGNPGPAGCGFVVVHPVTGTIREGFEYLGIATNNVAELTAILRGVEAIADVAAPIRVHTDSSYAIGVLQKGWKAKANPELIARIRTELERRPNVHIVYVPGHAGVPMNERADELAREAVTSRGSRLMEPE